MINQNEVMDHMAPGAPEVELAAKASSTSSQPVDATVAGADDGASRKESVYLSPPPPSNDDEVPSEDSVQFGLAKGTTNTYAIPGMDEMTPEEYRTKLQETISGRQVRS